MNMTESTGLFWLSYAVANFRWWICSCSVFLDYRLFKRRKALSNKSITKSESWVFVVSINILIPLFRNMQGSIVLPCQWSMNKQYVCSCCSIEVLNLFVFEIHGHLLLFQSIFYVCLGVLSVADKCFCLWGNSWTKCTSSFVYTCC